MLHALVIVVVLTSILTLWIGYWHQFPWGTIQWRLFGHKTHALFDLWSLQHFATGCLLGWGIQTIMVSRNEPLDTMTLTAWTSLIMISVVWEIVEWSGEIDSLGSRIAVWKDGLEYWANRCITDVGLVLSGGLLVRRFPTLLLPALLFTLIWVPLNTSQITCMDFQEELFSSENIIAYLLSR